MSTEILQSPLVVVTIVSLIAALAVAVYSLTCWRQRNMMHFAFLACSIALNILGYFLEVTAQSLDTAIVACKVAYLGIPLTGTLLYFFSLDFSDRIHLKRISRVILLALAPLFTAAVFAYPYSTIFFQDLALSTKGLVSHLEITPGILYYPSIIYNSFFSLLAFVNLMIGFFSQKRLEGGIFFIIAVLVPILAYFYTSLFGLIDGWNPAKTALTLSIVLLAVYLARYKQPEWQSMGRELVVQDMNDAFILLDSKGVVIDHNLSAESYFPELRQNKRIRYKLEDIWDFPSQNYLLHAVHTFDIQQGEATKNLKVSTSPLKANDKVIGTLVVINDDTANTQLMNELTRLARVDELTGLKNRATFFHDASLSFNLACRQEENKGCALMMDIDFFKNINDTYGHAAGDEVLVYIGKLLQGRFRQTDICGRYGGEELSVWMPATTLPGALQVAEEIRLAIESKTFEYEDITFNVTISIGIACMRESHPMDFEDLLKKADYALYEAKNTGRNRVCVYGANNPIQCK